MSYMLPPISPAIASSSTSISCSPIRRFYPQPGPRWTFLQDRSENRGSSQRQSAEPLVPFEYRLLEKPAVEE